MRCYLYCLNFPNGKRYIGATTNLARRRGSHKHSPKSSQQGIVPKAIATYGMPPMTVLCVGSRGYIADLEEQAILAFRTNDPAFGYNIEADRTSRSEQTRAAIKAALAKSQKFVAVRQRIGGWNKGVPHSAETRAKLSVANKGRRKSPEHRAKIAAAMRGNHNRKRQLFDNKH